VPVGGVPVPIRRYGTVCSRAVDRDCFVDANLRFFSSPLFLFGGEDMDIVLTESHEKSEIYDDWS